MYKKHKETMDRGKIRLISFISFLMGFIQAVSLYVLSSYFMEAAGTENVGPFYLGAYSISLIILLNLHKVIRVLGKSNVFLFSMLAKIVSLVLLIFFPPSIFSIAFLMLYIIALSLEWVVLDVILESFSIDNMSGRIRGKHLTVVNAGFLIGPFISTRLLDLFGFEGVFSFSLALSAFMFVISLIGLRNVNHKFELKLSSWDLIKKVYAQKDIFRIYYVAFVLEFFYALMVVYTPFYLLDLGMSWGQIGWIFTAMLLPFVLVQYPMGVFADKRFGEKEFLIFSLFLMGLSTLFIYFFSSHSVLLWSVILFATRIGAALVEVLRDSYFYKRVDGHDVDIINFFRTSQAVGYIISSFCAFLIIQFFPHNPIKFIFVLVAVVSFSAIYPVFLLKDSKCEAEMKKTC